MMRPGIFTDTFLESFRNRMFLIFFIASSICVGSIALAMNMDIVNGVLQGYTVFGQQLNTRGLDVARFVQSIQAGLAMLISVVGLFLALMATSTLFPQMTQKGSIELLLCRPVSRWRIITGRFLGGAAIMAFNATYLFLGVWLVLGLKSGVWTRGFPWSTILVIFAFIVLFSVMMAASVATDNGVVGLLIAYVLVVFSPILAAHDRITPALSTELYRKIFRFLYWIVPKTAETIGAARRLILQQPLEIGIVVATSAAFAVACWVFTVVYFDRKDY